jgi:hypothetical protein
LQHDEAPLSPASRCCCNNAVVIEWKVRFATRDDLPAMRKCFSDTFGHSRPLERDVSLRFRNPEGTAISAIAEVSGDVVGHFGLFPLKLRLGGESFPSAKSFDAMTRSGYRGQGMMGALAEACFERIGALGVDAIFAFPNRHSLRPLLRANYTHVTDLPVLRRQMAAVHSTRGTGARGAAVSVAGRLLPKGRQRGFATEVKVAHEAPLEEILLLWQHQGGICRVDRSLEWWSWRFSPQMGEYEWIVSRTGTGSLAAAVVLAASEPQASIVEVVGSDPRAVESAVSVAVRRAESAGCASMRTSTNRPEALRALRRASFIKRGGLPLLVRRISQRTLPVNLSDSEAWRVTAADMETF